MLKVCLVDSSMRLGVPFIAPRQLEAVGGILGRLILPYVGWQTGQSGAPPDSHCSCPVRDLLLLLAHPTIVDSWQLAHWTLSGAHRTVRCPLPTVGAPTCRTKIARPTVGAVDRWLTRQSGAPPVSLVNFIRTPLILFPRATTSPQTTHRIVRCTTDSPVNYSRTPPSSPESGLFTRDWPGAPDTVWCTTGQSGAPRPSRSWLYTANSFPIAFLLFLALRHNTLVPKSMY
jgi:hypothetical protein